MEKLPSYIWRGAEVWDIEKQCYGIVENWRWCDIYWLVDHTGITAENPPLTPVNLLMPAYVLMPIDEEPA